jgi:RNA polymerase sigma-B factor
MIRTRHQLVSSGSGSGSRAACGGVATSDPEDREPLHASVGEVEDGYVLVEMTASLAAAMPRLPYLERRALIMRLGDNLKQTEIADRLGCSQMQVSRLLRRACTRLRELTDPDTRERADD